MSNFTNATFRDVHAELLRFRDARDWKQFHTPRQLAAALAIEAAEVQQVLLWKSDEEVQAEMPHARLRDQLGDELADVISFALLLVGQLGLDPAELVQQKIRKNAERYPVEKCRGSGKKYSEL